jgi:hypothetical protein
VILYPNPAWDESAIKYYAGGGESLTVKLFDMAGRVVLEHKTGSLAAGISGITLSLGSLNEGLYQMTINNGKEQVSRKLLIQR